MTIEEIKQKKKALEVTMVSLFNQFSDDTGVEIFDVGMEKADMTPMGSAPVISYQVKLKMEIG